MKFHSYIIMGHIRSQNWESEKFKFRSELYTKNFVDLHTLLKLCVGNFLTDGV